MADALNKPISQMDAVELERKRLELMERQIALQEAQSQIMATQQEQNRPKENPNYTPSSPNLQKNGEPWAKVLKCKMFLGSIDLQETPLSQAEVEMLNRINPSDTSVSIRKVDNSVATMSVVGTVTASGKVDSLRFVMPMSKDSNPQHYPPLLDLARQIAEQTAVSKV